MSKSFNKFKRRVRAQSITVSALLGVGVSAVGLAAVILVGKLGGNVVNPIFYLFAAVLASALSLVLYFIFMPSDKRLAKRLDSLYGLDERVSTMVELRDDDGVFARLQREDADLRLGEKPIKSLKARQLVAGLLVFCISVGCIVGALIVPVKADGGESVIDEFDKQWLITAIGELITTVENAYINDNLRGMALTELNSLLEFVESSDYLSEMKTKAISTVLGINLALVEANSAESLAFVFSESSNDSVKELAKSLGELAGSGSKNALIALGESIAASGVDDRDFTADELDSYLAASGVHSGDKLYLLFKGLTASIRGGSDIEDEFSTAATALSAEVIVQNVNRSTMRIVINKLCNLFGITEDDLTSVAPDTDIDIDNPGTELPPSDGDGEEPDKNINSGGLGTGEVIYGSNDLVFDPDTNTHRPLGELLGDYFAKANEQITDGKASDELSDAAEEYFGTLFDGAPKND